MSYIHYFAEVALRNNLILNIRMQHPVGQGFFHSGQIRAGKYEFNYIYDCGSENKEELIHEVESYLKNHSKIEVLFLSHLHRDHVNGLDHLLGGSKVETVVMPYLSWIERIILIADALEKGVADMTYIQLCSDPVRWFGDRGIDRILHIKGGSTFEGKAPPENTEPIIEGPITLDFGKFKSQRNTDEPAKRLVRRAESFTIGHDIPLQLKGKGCTLNWMFLTFVHPEKKGLGEFGKALNKGFGRRFRFDKMKCKNPDKKWLLEILQDCQKRRQLTKCYEKVRSDLNLTSLSLYVGPIKANGLQCYLDSIPPFYHQILQDVEKKIGWIGTGDANLKSEDRRSIFQQHFQSIEKYIMTMALPHHGSKHNFHKSLLNMAEIFYVAAGSHNRHGHPHSEVELDVKKAGKLFFEVTEKPRTEFMEIVLFGPKR